jgi:hypothetical protein
VYPLQQVKFAGATRPAVVFFDSGSNATFIAEHSVQALKAKRIKPVELTLVTMGNNERSYSTTLYEVKLQKADNVISVVHAFGIPEIMGKVPLLDPDLVSSIFPEFPVKYLPRSTTVDILIGNDYFGLHPKQNVHTAGEHLGMVKGPLGVCLQGSHPALRLGKTQETSLFAYSNSCFKVKSMLKPTHTELSEEPSLCKGGKVANFIVGEELGVEVAPRCGGCKCTKCPVPGHTFSFTEERELDLIRSNLQYDAESKRWVTSYPWIVDPTNLPDNYCSVLATLKSTERKLKSDDSWARIYKAQIEDMVLRGVARKLSAKELSNWKGPKFYISHLAVVNPKSSTTPVRIVFNSSQKYEGVSLNSFLAKGPDNYLNSLLGILLRWREGQVALVNDVSKMYHSVFTTPVEQHCHRFLWRDFEDRQPDIYVIQRVNMGDRPAGAISTEALYKTADMFEGQFPNVSFLLRKSTYVDDIVHSVESFEEAMQLKGDTEYVLSQAGFTLKEWSSNISGLTANHDRSFQLRTLGLQWKPQEDVIKFEPFIDFSPKKKGNHKGPDLSSVNLPRLIPELLTRHMVLEQVMRVYDPLGLLSPFMLKLVSCWSTFEKLRYS